MSSTSISIFHRLIAKVSRSTKEFTGVFKDLYNKAMVFKYSINSGIIILKTDIPLYLSSSTIITLFECKKAVL